MRTSKRRLLAMGVAAALVAFPLMGNAAPPKAGDTGEKPAPKMETVSYLGVAVASPHASLWPHLRDLFEREQGLVVVEVAKDSPADKAGITPHDILLTFADQKLYEPEQLAKLVRADKPGTTVVMEVVHEGEKQDVKVTVGQHQVPVASAGAESRMERMLRMPMMRRMMRRPTADSGEDWESFDSLTMKKLGDNRFKVEIRYLDKEGKTQQHSFEGTRKEIYDDIVGEKDLPDSERDHLLSALNLEEIEENVPMFDFRDFDSLFQQARPF